jgi:heat shock protein HslJ
MALIIILTICICGCTQVSPSQVPATPGITRLPTEPILFPTIPPHIGPPSSTWYLVALQDENESISFIPETVISAFFDGKGRVSGSAGCNQYTAVYSGIGKNLTVGSPVSTRMNCGSPEGIMGQETLYLRKIQEAQTYSAVGDSLTLSDDRGDSVLHFTLVPTGTRISAPLLGTTWYVDSLTDSTGQTLMPAGLTTITLFFGNDGKVYGNSGCNDYFGSYQKTGEDSAKIGDLHMTGVSCGIAGVMELETAYLTLLPNLTGYSISGDTLLLSDPGSAISVEFDTKTP